MNLPFFYAPGLTPDTASPELEEETMRHMVQVLRMKVGDELMLTNGKGQKAHVVISAASKKTCSVSVLSFVEVAHALTHHITIAISPLKNPARFEWFLEKAAENGTARILPLLCSRTEKQHIKKERWNNILVSAMLQSQQCWLTELMDPLSFAACISSADGEHKYIAHCLEAEKPELQQLVRNDHRSSLILIGPEGDFTPQEVASAIAAGFKEVSLGQTRLRTETAGITAAVLLTHSR